MWSPRRHIARDQLVDNAYRYRGLRAARLSVGFLVSAVDTSVSAIVPTEQQASDTDEVADATTTTHRFPSTTLRYLSVRSTTSAPTAFDFTESMPFFAEALLS